MKIKAGIGFSGTEVKGDFELPCGCCGLNPGLLEEQSFLLATEPSLQLLEKLYLGVWFEEILSVMPWKGLVTRPYGGCS